MKSVALKINLFLFLLPFCLFAQKDMVRKEIDLKPEGMVSDYAKLLSAQERNDLERKLRNYRDTTSTEIAIVIEKSLNGEDQLFRSRDIARAFGIGQKDKNNGILIYVAVEDRKISIRTANKTSGAVVDHEASSAIIQEMQSAFRAKQYAAGLNRAVDYLTGQLGNEFTNDAVATFSWWPFILIIGIIILFLLLLSRGNKFNRGYRGGGAYWFPTGNWGNWNSGGGGGDSGGSSWGGFGGGGGFDGGGADGGW